MQAELARGAGLRAGLGTGNRDGAVVPLGPTAAAHHFAFAFTLPTLCARRLLGLALMG